MARVLAHYLSMEVAVLGLLDALCACFVFALTIAAPGLAALPGPAVQSPTDGAATVIVVLGLTAATIGLYRRDIWLDRRRLLATACVATAIAVPIVLLLRSTSHPGSAVAELKWLAKLLTVGLICMLITRTALGSMIRRSGLARRVLILGNGLRAARMCELLRSRAADAFDPVVAQASMTNLSVATLVEQGIWGVVIAADGAEAPDAETLLDSKLRGMRVLDDTSFYENHLGRLDLETIDTNWLLHAEGFAHGRMAAFAKRAMDLAGAALLLVCALPIMLLTAVAIWCEAGGPVFYRQQRVGLHGKAFTLFKFRSMTVDAEADGDPLWAQHADPRVTRVGAFIRPLRIDELPQLFNVLRGEMSIIGPRPERPHFVEQLSRIIPFYRERSYVKPGITGWAQINYPYGASVEDAREKLSYDLYYVKNRNILLDMLILLSTVRVILFREGAR